MQEFERQLEIVAPSGLPVLLQGESGCGKEVAARALHAMSARRHGPLVPVNCASLATHLVESLLCGHVRGAFTGAEREQPGYVRAAQGGTLFLDELGELPAEAQGRLLRILQEKSVLPVGGQREIPVDFRLVCATHRDLEDLVAKGVFRQDLYFRVAAFPIRLPALRDRRDDLPDIAANLWKGANPPEVPGLSVGEMEALLGFAWPGNIRQLRNVLERYALLRGHGVTLADVLAVEPGGCPGRVGEPLPVAYRAGRCRAPEWPRIVACLGESGWNKSRAARLLGISRGALCYQVRKNGK